MNTSLESITPAIAALSDSIPQHEWRNVDAPNCRAVQGLKIARARILLPEGVELEEPSSPIVEIAEAEELYARFAPNTADEGVLRPLLHRIVFENDRGKSRMSQRRSLIALWLLFASIEHFDGLRLLPGEEPPEYFPGGQARVGGQRLYIKEVIACKPLELSNSLLGTTPSPREVARYDRARRRDPAQWTEAHQTTTEPRTANATTALALPR